MKERFLDFLVCIECGGSLHVGGSVREGSDIVTGKLQCNACSESYPILRGIPRMMPRVLEKEKRATAKNFGYEWLHFREVSEHHRQQFLDWIHPIPADSFHGKIVLDAGCGKGRHVYWAAQFGAQDVIGVDLSDAVEVAYENTKHLPNVHIVQADIFSFPFHRATFDLIYSIGVLHHLPDPRAGFMQLIRHLKKGGTIAIWVYGRENNGWIIYGINPLRSITSRLPLSAVSAFAFLIALPLTLALKAFYAPVNRYAPRLAAHLFYNAYLGYISKFPFREIYSIVFDHLLAPTAFYLRREEIAGWFVRDDLTQIVLMWHNQNSWHASAEKKGKASTSASSRP